MSQSCTRQTIVIRRRRGGTVLFHGRPGGQKKHGGACSNRGPSARQKTAQNRLASAARSCAKKVGTFRGIARCVAQKLG